SSRARATRAKRIRATREATRARWCALSLRAVSCGAAACAARFWFTSSARSRRQRPEQVAGIRDVRAAGGDCLRPLTGAQLRPRAVRPRRREFYVDDLDLADAASGQTGVRRPAITQRRK